MASLTIKLEIDPNTGKKNVIVGYESDADALPMEHEDDHKRLLEKLMAGGVIKGDEIGNIKITRETQQIVEEQKQEQQQRNSIDQSN